MFRGHFRHTIDPKGRLSIPSKFREGLRESGSDRLVIAPNGKSLDVYPEDKWRELEEKRGRFSVRAPVDQAQLFMPFFDYAQRLADGAPFDRAAARDFVRKTLQADYLN